MARIEGSKRVGFGIGQGEALAAFAAYDFATEGGAVGLIALRSDPIPAGAILIDSLVLTDIVPVGATATISVGVETAADVQAAAGVAAAPWSTTGPKRGSLVNAVAPVLLTADRTIRATVATAALTAGRFRVIVWYITAAPAV